MKSSNMTNPPPSPPLGNHLKDSHHQSHPHVSSQPHDSNSHSNGKMKLGKSICSPTTQSELPPLVGVPHSQKKHQYSHQTTPDSTAIHSVYHGAQESEIPVGSGTASPLMRRRLKFMVRQFSDSELHVGPGAASPVPHPPDISPRSPSSGSNSPQIFHKPLVLNTSRSGPKRTSRSLESSPLVIRRVRDGMYLSIEQGPDLSGQESSAVPSSPSGIDRGKTRRPRPLSFGSFTDVTQHVASNNESPPSQTNSPRGVHSPYLIRRQASLRGGILIPPSRPDTPVTESMSVYDSKKHYNHQQGTSSGECSYLSSFSLFVWGRGEGGVRGKVAIKWGGGG